MAAEYRDLLLVRSVADAPHVGELAAARVGECGSVGASGREMVCPSRVKPEKRLEGTRVVMTGTVEREPSGETLWGPVVRFSEGGGLTLSGRCPTFSGSCQSETISECALPWFGVVLDTVGRAGVLLGSLVGTL